MEKIHGMLVINKQLGVTSRDAVNEIQDLLPRKTKIGHAGTLDPLASGVLVIGIGFGTKLVEFVQAQPKIYEANVRLGWTSVTDDAEGPLEQNPVINPPTIETIQCHLNQFVGNIEQIPPLYSAVHTQGKRAYQLARRGQTVELSPRSVVVHAIEIVHYEWPHLKLLITCGKGTYIRSIARDLGKILGTGGYLAALQRTKVGSYALKNAAPRCDSLADVIANLLPLSTALTTFPSLQIKEADVVGFCQGKFLPYSHPNAAIVVVLKQDGNLLGLASSENGLLKPDKVFHQNTQ
ncbi:MAG: tRNA pseudouridine(55) synthase TruB [Zavarzinella sp.]